jgi:hypothetical protein
MENIKLIEEKGKCPRQIAELISDFLEYNKYEIKEENFKENDYNNYLEINLDDGTTILGSWNDYTMQITFKGILNNNEYQTFISLPTMRVVNLNPRSLGEQLYPIGVYTLISNENEKTVVACNPYVYSDEIDVEPNTFKQWELAKQTDLPMNQIPLLQVNKYSADANISNIDQGDEVPLSRNTELVNLFVNPRQLMNYNTLFTTIQNTLMVTEDYKANYTSQKIQ